jgi:hypothetical protein
MRTTYSNNARGGHCSAHVRGTFLAALDAYLEWAPGEPEPTVEYEVDHEAREIPISKAAKLVWNCSDILPCTMRSTIEMTDLGDHVQRWTYAGTARAMVKSIMA